MPASSWVLADIHLAGVPAPPDEMEIYWNAAGPLVLLPITRGRYRLIADVAQTEAGEHPSEPTLEEVQALIDSRGPPAQKRPPRCGSPPSGSTSAS